ncbi:DUF397 domain-containing protein [Streptomyces crystallinus]|uniref:DUF397 domain-containing protein n=1 Tax=Streptomyces crystallinus TaxID=68191 RepID=A0ABP3QGJ2_9ACTN
MGTSQDLADVQWRKSSYSGGGGGDCVEVAEVSHLVAIRDSTRPEGAALTVSPGAFGAFVDSLTRHA